jgi:hypothetical protein
LLDVLILWSERWKKSPTVRAEEEPEEEGVQSQQTKRSGKKYVKEIVISHNW